MTENNKKQGGWIKVYKSISDWKYRKKPNFVSVWLELLLKAGWERGEVDGHTLERGSLMTTPQTLALSTGLTYEQVRHILRTLQRTKEITIKGTTKNTIITICKYDEYQRLGEIDAQTKPQSNSRNNHNQTHETVTIYKNIEEDKEDKEDEIKESLNSLALNFFEEGISAKAKQLLYQLAQRNGIGDEVVDAFVMANLNNMGRNNDNSHPYAICDSKGVTIQKVAEAFIAFSTRHNDKVPPFDVVEKIFMKRIALKGGRANGLKASEFYEYLKSTGKQYKGEKGIVSAANAWINKRISQP